MDSADKNPLRRADPRIEASHAEIHGIATRTHNKNQGPFVVWDLSNNGLRLWVAEHVRTGEIVRLTIARPFVIMLTVEVRWCKAAADGNGFHVGVRALDNLNRLEALGRRVLDLAHPLGDADGRPLSAGG